MAVSKPDKPDMRPVILKNGQELTAEQCKKFIVRPIRGNMRIRLRKILQSGSENVDFRNSAFSKPDRPKKSMKGIIR